MTDRFKMTGKTLQKWKATSPAGEVIKDGLFIPFKAPYENINIAEDDQFTTEMCLDLLRLKQVRIGFLLYHSTNLTCLLFIG